MLLVGESVGDHVSSGEVGPVVGDSVSADGAFVGFLVVGALVGDHV